VNERKKLKKALFCKEGGARRTHKSTIIPRKNRVTGDFRLPAQHQIQQITTACGWSLFVKEAKELNFHVCLRFKYSYIFRGKLSHSGTGLIYPVPLCVCFVFIG